MRSQMLNTSSKKLVLVADDDQDVLNTAKVALRPLAADIAMFTDRRQLLSAVESSTAHAILLDMNFTAGQRTGEEGMQLLDELVRLAPDVSVVLMTAYGGVSLAVAALKRGAADFVLKPWQNEKLVATMNAAIELTAAKRDAAQLSLQHDTLALEKSVRDAGVSFTSPRIAEITSLVGRAAPTSANILLLGESGTGKEVTARDIHRLSKRSTRPFVSVDLGAVPESLFESELFGHRKGAFTGASSDRIGLVEAADGGTLFLDEIGNLPAHLQTKLLAVLERREILPVGASRPVPVDIRLISATNLSAEELANPARFRADLLYRIKTVQIVIPPLRERREDVQPLLSHFLAYYAQKHRVRQRALSPAALQLLETYDWPGNIRELRHAAESATILAQGDVLAPEDFAFARLENADATGKFDLGQLERDAIRRALDHFGGNISKAALALGLTRPALYRRILRHGL
jgi:two-component system, NtrC family, response regulator HydG